MLKSTKIKLVRDGRTRTIRMRSEKGAAGSGGPALVATDAGCSASFLFPFA
jgi:hypothetical protein